MLEKDLFLPLKNYFESLNYVVEGEVKDCDILIKDTDTYMAVELKTDFNLKVILQAVERQKLFECVYIALPVQKVKLRSKSYLQKVHLLKRLGIGLLLVHTVTGEVNCAHPPLVQLQTKAMANAKRKRERVVEEFERRVLKNNVGGVSKTKITTAFRESCYLILLALENNDLSSKDIVIKGLETKQIYGILYRNVYGWFEKRSKGVYGLSTLGREVLREERKIITAIQKAMQEKE